MLAGELRAVAMRGAAWSAAYRWSARLVSFGTFAVLSRLLEPAQFGVVALAASVSGFLSILVDFGLPRFIVQRAQVDEVERNTLIWGAVALGTAVALLQVAAAPLIAGFLDEPSVSPVLQVLAIGYPISALYGMLSGLQKRKLAFRLLAIRGIVAVFLSAVVAVGMAVAGLGVWALVGQTLTYTTASWLVLWSTEPWRPSLRVSRPVLVEACRYGAGSLAAAAMDAIGKNIDAPVVGHRLGVEQLGFYSVAFRLVHVVLDLLVSVVHSVAFPILARAKSDSRLLAAAYRHAVAQGVLVSAPAIALVAALMPQLIEVLFGPRWAPVASVGAVIAIARGLLVPVWFDSSLLYAINRVRLEFRLAALSAATVAVAVVVGSLWGLMGVAVALLGRSVILGPVRMAVSCHVTGQPLAPVVGTVMRLWAAATAAGVVAALLGRSIESDLLGILLGGGAGMLTFLAVAGLVARAELTYAIGTFRLGTARS